MAKYAHDDDYDKPREPASPRQAGKRLSGKMIGAVAVVIAIIASCVFLLFVPWHGNEVLGSLGKRTVHGIAARGSIVAQFHSGDGITATVKLGEQTANVTADHVELATGRKVKIPPSCKIVELRESRNGMRVFFDRVEAP